MIITGHIVNVILVSGNSGCVYRVSRSSKRMLVAMALLREIVF